MRPQISNTLSVRPFVSRPWYGPAHNNTRYITNWKKIDVCAQSHPLPRKAKLICTPERVCILGLSKNNCSYPAGLSVSAHNHLIILVSIEEIFSPRWPGATGWRDGERSRALTAPTLCLQLKYTSVQSVFWFVMISTNKVHLQMLGLIQLDTKYQDKRQKNNTDRQGAATMKRLID